MLVPIILLINIQILTKVINAIPVDAKLIKYTDIKKLTRNVRSASLASGVISSEMVIHQYSYKPRGFSLSSKRLSDKKVMIEFNYTVNDHIYDKYAIRMRYYNEHLEYMTNKSLLTVNESNILILKNFPPAQYVLCVTLFPSVNLINSLYYPISSSDMCIDVEFGEEHTTRHHSNGLLEPVLLAVVFLELMLITLLQKVKFAAKKARQSKDSTYSNLKKKENNSLEAFNYILKFNQEYIEMAKLQKMMLYYDDRQRFNSANNFLIPNKTFGDLEQAHNRFVEQRRMSRDLDLLKANLFQEKNKLLITKSSESDDNLAFNNHRIKYFDDSIRRKSCI
jgi:hypothetical protein